MGSGLFLERNVLRVKVKGTVFSYIPQSFNLHHILVVSYLDYCFLDSFSLWSFYFPAFFCFSFPLSFCSSSLFLVVFLFFMFVFFFIWKVKPGILIKQLIYFCLFILLSRKKCGRLGKKDAWKSCLTVCWVICDFLCQTFTAPRCRKLIEK